MTQERKLHQLIFKGTGDCWKFKGPENIDFYIENINHISEEEQFFLQQLCENKTVLLFNQYFSATFAFAASSLNNKVHVLFDDTHPLQIFQQKIPSFDNINCHLEHKLPKVSNDIQHAFLIIKQNSQRLVMFDILENLAEIMPENSIITIAVTKKRQKDFAKKLGSILKETNKVFRTKECLIFQGRLRKNIASFNERKASFEVSNAKTKINCISYPGVFCHNKIDQGGLALSEVAELRDNESVLELGTGYGITSLLILKKMQEDNLSCKEALLVDSSFRAIKACQENIIKNNLEATTCHTHNFKQDKTFDVVLANPPYYADKRIGLYFIQTAQDHLKKNGRLYLVSKHGNFYSEILENHTFFDSTIIKRRTYDILIANKK